MARRKKKEADEAVPLETPRLYSDLWKAAAVGNLKMLKYILQPKLAAAEEAERIAGPDKAPRPADAESKSADSDDGSTAEPQPPASKPVDNTVVMDVNTKDARGMSALCYAARQGQLQCVKYFLGLDADIESTSAGGRTAIHLSALFGHEAVLSTLVEAGGDVAAVDALGNTAIHYAAGAGVLNLVVYLMEHGADIEAKNKSGATTIAFAASGGHRSIVARLIKAEVDVSAADSSGNTALHVAAQCGFQSVVRLLLSNGARPSANRAGKTPADLANTPAIQSDITNFAETGEFGSKAIE